MQRKNLKSMVSVTNHGNAVKTRRRQALLLALVAGAGSVGLQSSQSQAATWDGSVNDFGATTTTSFPHWNAYPGGANNNVEAGVVTISTASSTAQAGQVAGQVVVNDILAGTTGTGNGTWVQTGNTVTANGWMRFGTVAGGTGTYNQSAGVLNFNGNGNIGEVATGIVNLSGTAVWNMRSSGNSPVAIGGSGSGGGQSTSRGTMNMSGGTINTNASEFWIGNGNTGTVGVVNMSGGTLNANNWLSVGRAGGTGTLNFSGGVINKTGGGHISLTGIGGTGVINQTGGTINSTGAGEELFLTENNSGTYNFSAGIGNFVGINTDTNGGTGTVNLSGTAVLNTGPITRSAAGGSGNLNFNGGNINAIVASTAFIPANVNTKIDAGGLKFGMAGFSETIASSIAHTGTGTDGGLIATGTGGGTLTLSGINTYTGPTSITNANLLIRGASLPQNTRLLTTGSSLIDFGGNFLSPQGSTTPGLTLLDFSDSASTNLQFGIATTGADQVAVTNAAALGTGGTITVNVGVGQTLTPGAYTLLSDTNGGVGGFSLTNSTIITGGNQYSLSLSSTSTADILTVGVGQVAKLYYTGNSSNSLNVAGNFSNNVAGTVTATSAPTAITDVVLTANTATTANFGATLGGLASVNSLEFTGTGTPAASTPVTISGPGTLNINAGANTFAAGTGIVIDAGLAAGSGISANLNLPVSQSITNNSGSQFALSGVISSTNPNTVLTLGGAAGTGGFLLSGANTYSGTTVIPGSAVVLGSATALGNSGNFVQVNSLSASLDINGNAVQQGGITFGGGVLKDTVGTGSLTLTATGATGAAINITNATAPGYINPVPAGSNLTAVPLTFTGATNYIAKSINAGTPVITSNITLNGNTIVAMADTGGDNSGELNLTGTISGPGSLGVQNNAVIPGVTFANQQDWGTLLLTGTNTFTGGTNIAFGRIVVTNSKSLSTGPITIGQNATPGGPAGVLQLGNNAYSATSSPQAIAAGVTGINLTNNINLGGETATGNGADYGFGIGNSQGSNTLSGNIALTGPLAVIDTGATATAGSGTLTLSGVISGAGQLQKNGTTQMIVTNANTITGGFNVTTGELLVQNNLALGTGTTIVGTNTAGVNIPTGFTLANPFSINGSGVALGGAILASGTNSTVTGPIDLGTLGTAARIGATTGSTLFVTGPIHNGTTGVSLDISGLGAGTAGGTVVLSGSSDYTGITTVIRGHAIVDGTTLTAGQSNISSTGNILIDTSGTAGEVGTLVIQNGGVVKSTVGNVLIANAVGNTGSLTITSGSLVTGGNVQVGLANTSTGSINLSSGTLTAANFVIGNTPIGSTSTATVTQTAGTINSHFFSVGFSGGGTGTANLSGGTLNVRSLATYTDGELEVGIFDSIVGSLTIGAGQAVNLDNNANFVVGSQNTSAANSVVQNAGTVTFYSNTGTTVGGTGSLILGRTNALATASGAESYTLNGGTLTVPSISRSSTSVAGTGTFNFNGGTLVAAADSPTFIQGLSAFKVGPSGGTFDTNGHTVVVAQPMLDNGGGGLTLNDSAVTHGKLTLAGSSTLTGAVTINAGTLSAANTTGSATGSGAITINGGALASGTVGNVDGLVSAGTGPNLIAPGDVGSIGSLKIGGIISSGQPANLTTINFDLGAGPATVIGGNNIVTNGDLLTMAAGSLVLFDTGTALTFGGAPVSGNDYRLIADSDAIAASSNSTIDPAAFALPTPTGGATYSLSTSVDPGYLDLVVGGVVVTTPQNLTWNNTGGSGDGVTFDTTMQNFNNGTGAATFSSTNHDNVTFNDTNNGHYAVSIPSTVTPGSTTVNSAANYNFSGAGGIGGTGTLVKSGAGTLTLATVNTYTGGTNVSGGKLVLSGAGAFPSATSLTIGTGATVQIAAHTGPATNVVVVKTSSFTSTGLVDLTNNDLVVQGGTTLAAITTQIQTGYAGGTFAGTSGITSSTAAADSTHLTTIGVANGLTSFEGATVSATDTLVKYTYYGDANLDGAVDGSDYTKIDAAFGTAASGWQNGDFNYDNKIDGSDYTLIDNAFNTQGTTLGTNPAALIASATSQIASGSSAVPEPTTLGLLGVGAVGMLARRRRRNV